MKKKSKPRGGGDFWCSIVGIILFARQEILLPLEPMPVLEVIHITQTTISKTWKFIFLPEDPQ